MVINNYADDCPKWCENLTNLNYFYSNNKNFYALTNDYKKYNKPSIIIGSPYTDKNICLKCNKNQIKYSVLPCKHKIYCK